MKKLTGNILRTFSTQIPSIIIGIVAGIFLTRLLGAEGKGIYAIFYANIEIMVMVFAFGCDMGIIYFGSNKKISNSKLQAIAVYVLALFIPLIGIIILTLKIDFLLPDKYDSLFFKLFLLVMFSLTLINVLLSAFLKTAKSFKSINRITLINSILNILTFSTIFFLKSKGLVHVNLNLIFGVSIIIMIFNTIFLLISFLIKVPLHPDFTLSIKRDVFPFFKYIFPIFISIVINFLNYRFDIWLVSYYQGNVQLGLYVLAVNFAQFILLYSRIIGSVMMPYLSEDNDSQRKKYFTVYSRINFTSIIAMVLFLAIFGQSLIVFLYGKEFAESTQPFNILLIGMVFTAMSQLFGILLFSKGKNNVSLIATSTGLVITIVFDVLLIPKYGIIGAAIATCLSYFFIFMVFLYYLLIIEKIKFIELFLIKRADFTQIFKND